jgi:NAD-dependent SIR2 family protein deacetylase
MKREKRTTKRERKAESPTPAQPQAGQGQHIHCIACGKHLDAQEFSGATATALYLTCDHSTRFPSCAECQVTARYLIAEHDRTGNPVATAQAWH